MTNEPDLDFNHRPKPPGFTERVNAYVDRALINQRNAESSRQYLGASQLGDPCLRRIQYGYSHTSKDEGSDFSGSLLRIFATGHAYEALAVDWLRAAGFDLRTTNRSGEQFGFETAEGRIKGHIDGVIVAGPEGLNYPALWECKSMKSANWRELVKRGVAVSKPVYYVQMQLYMAYMQLTENPGILTAVNKDNSELWHEQVPFDASVAQKYSDRAVQILKATEAQEWLPRIAADPHYFECKMCPYQKRCWNER